MQISKRGIDLITQFEGLRLKPYRCAAGVPTIGYGHTAGVHMSDPPITQEDAVDYLLDDLSRYEAAVNELVKVPLTQNQYDALVSFAFNVGTGALKRSTLLRMLNAGDYQGAADQFTRWNKAGKQQLRGLTRRREAERKLFLEAEA